MMIIQMTPLFAAARRDHVEVVKIRLEHGADVNGMCTAREGERVCVVYD